MSNKRTTPRQQPKRSMYVSPQVQRPQIQIDGSARLAATPETGEIDVTITGTGATHDTAWASFQEQLAALRTNLDGIATLGSAIPTEASSEVQKALRTITEVTVSASVTIRFSPPDFGFVLKPLVEGRHSFGKPRFTFAEEPSITPELLGRASNDARERATAVAAGVGATLGRLIMVRTGKMESERRLASLRQVLNRSFDLSSNTVTYFRRTDTSEQPPLSIDPDEFGIDLPDIETVDTVAHVTVTFELVMDSEVAA